MWRDFELCTIAKSICGSTAVGGLQCCLIFFTDGEKYGESRTSIHHVNEKREMDICPSLFFGPSGET